MQLYRAYSNKTTFCRLPMWRKHVNKVLLWYLKLYRTSVEFSFHEQRDACNIYSSREWWITIWLVWDPCELGDTFFNFFSNFIPIKGWWDLKCRSSLSHGDSELQQKSLEDRVELMVLLDDSTLTIQWKKHCNRTIIFFSFTSNKKLQFINQNSGCWPTWQTRKPVDGFVLLEVLSQLKTLSQNVETNFVLEVQLLVINHGINCVWIFVKYSIKNP